MNKTAILMLIVVFFFIFALYEGKKKVLIEEIWNSKKRQLEC